MTIQDANQTTTYWCFGKVPPPRYVFTAGHDYRVYWVDAPVAA